MDFIVRFFFLSSLLKELKLSILDTGGGSCSTAVISGLPCTLYSSAALQSWKHSDANWYKFLTHRLTPYWMYDLIWQSTLVCIKQVLRSFINRSLSLSGKVFSSRAQVQITRSWCGSGLRWLESYFGTSRSVFPRKFSAYKERRLREWTVIKELCTKF